MLRFPAAIPCVPLHSAALGACSGLTEAHHSLPPPLGTHPLQRAKALVWTPPPEGGRDDSWTDLWTERAWHSVGHFTQRWKYTTVFAVLALMLVPFAPWLPYFDYTLDWSSGVPKGSEALRSYRALRNSFGAAVRCRRGGEGSCLWGCRGRVEEPPAPGSDGALCTVKSVGSCGLHSLSRAWSS